MNFRGVSRKHGEGPEKQRLGRSTRVERGMLLLSKPRLVGVSTGPDRQPVRNRQRLTHLPLIPRVVDNR